MGGHGALTLYLSSKTKQYRSASAFAPICNPTQCPWGEKAFKGYLADGVEEAKDKYDATELMVKHKETVHILVDYVRLIHHLYIQTKFYLQGTSDSFYKQGQLLPENFLKAARQAGHDQVQVRVRGQEGYDHSYYFVRPTPSYFITNVYSSDFTRFQRLLQITSIVRLNWWSPFYNHSFTS